MLRGSPQDNWGEISGAPDFRGSRFVGHKTSFRSWLVKCFRDNTYVIHTYSRRHCDGDAASREFCPRGQQARVTRERQKRPKNNTRATLLSLQAAMKMSLHALRLNKL